MKKKMFTLWMTGLFLLLTTLGAAAQNSGTTGPLNWNYDTGTKTLTITGTGAMPDFANADAQPWKDVRNEIEKVKIEAGVKSVGAYAFRNSAVLTSVTLPAGVQTIGEGAFGGCRKLASITLPSSLKTLGVSAFAGCDALTRIELPAALETIEARALNAGGLTEIKVQTGNTHFEAAEGVLYNKGQTALLRYPRKKPGTTFAVPASVTTIGEEAFSKCEALESITLPDALKTIGYNAFNECTALKSITIPKKVETIEDFAFRLCTELKDVTVFWNTPLTLPAGVFAGITPPTSVTLHVPGGTGEAYKGKDVWKELTIEELPWGDFDNGLHWAYDAATHSLTITNPTPSTPQPIPDFANPTKLPWKAYRGGIQTVTIGAGVNHVGAYAFTNCAKLATVTLPAGLKEIEKNAFGGCEKLTSINLPEGLKTIGEGAFTACFVLSDLTIPKSVKTIEENAFYQCGSLTHVTLPDDAQLTTIGKNAFFRCRSLTNLTIPKNVTTIGQSAFTECTALKSITIPNGVTAIADGVFAGCAALKSVTLPDGLQTIGKNAFQDCAALASISIPKSVTTIGSEAFSKCSALKDVTVAWETPIQPNSDAFKQLPLDKIRLHVPAGKIGAYLTANVWEDFIVMADRGDLAGGLKWQMDATYTLTIINPTPGTPKPMPDFNNWDEQPWKSFRSEIQAVTIEDGVSSVGETAFSGCTEMKSVTLPKSVTTIHEGAFGGCNKLTSVTLPADGRLDTIGKEAFSGCPALTSISLPKSATTIERSTFHGCEALTSVTLPADGKLQTIGSHAFGGCVKLKSITIPNSVTKIESDAFSRCKGLTSVTLPDNAQFTKIESDAFQDCKALERITIPNSVTTIEGRAFYGCTALASATLPKSVTMIGWSAFQDCKALKDLTVAWTDTASIPNISPYVFLNTPATVKLSDIRLHVPHGTVAAYQSKDVWKEFQIIEAVPPTPTLSVTPKTLSFIDAGETKTITVNVSAAWTAQCDASWITLSAASGTGDGTITVTAPIYEDEQPRTAKIIFTSNALKETVTVTQNPKPGPAFVALDYTELTLPAGASQRLVVTAYPKDADINRNVKWYSSNNDIATVSRDGTVTAIAPGRADITVVANVGGQQTACRVRVVPAEQMVSVTSGGDNTLRLALVAPSDADFTLSFDVDLPEGFALDTKKTAPDASLAASYTLTITGKRVEMKPNGLRSGSTMEKRNLLTFACTAAPGTSKGTYKAALRNLTFTPTAGYALQNITVPFTFTHTVANQTIDGLRVYAAGGALRLTLPKAETVHIYNVVGSLVRTMNASAGDHVLPLSAGVYVVRVGERVTKILIK